MAPQRDTTADPTVNPTPHESEHYVVAPHQRPDEPTAPSAVVAAPQQPTPPVVVAPTPPRDDVVVEHHRVETPALRDRIRWGPVWAGLVVALGIYLLLQLALVATGEIDVGDIESRDAWLSAGVALAAFAVGGLTTGATSIGNRVTDGILHGVVLWAIGVVALLGLSAASSGLALGALDASGVFENVTVDIESGIGDATDGDPEEAASWILLGLGAALLASVIGGAIGAKLWPRR